LDFGPAGPGRASNKKNSASKKTKNNFLAAKFLSNPILTPEKSIKLIKHKQLDTKRMDIATPRPKIEI
jgi:hypothetical protein